MTLYSFSVVIPANIAAPINLAVAAIAAGAYLGGYSEFSAKWLPCAKVRFSMASGGTGAGFVGGPNVTFQGAGAAYNLLTGATAGSPGQAAEIDSYRDANVLQLESLYIHGGNPGDLVDVSYWQA